MDEDTPVAKFEYVYVGEAGTRGTHLHAQGLCDHTGDLTPAFAHEVQAYERCGQCLNRATDLGIAVQPDVPLAVCPSCFLVEPCDCEN